MPFEFQGTEENEILTSIKSFLTKTGQALSEDDLEDYAVRIMKKAKGKFTNFKDFKASMDNVGTSAESGMNGLKKDMIAFSQSGKELDKISNLITACAQKECSEDLKNFLKSVSTGDPQGIAEGLAKAAKMSKFEQWMLAGKIGGGIMGILGAVAPVVAGVIIYDNLKAQAHPAYCQGKGCMSFSPDKSQCELNSSGSCNPGYTFESACNTACVLGKTITDVVGGFTKGAAKGIWEAFGPLIIAGSVVGGIILIITVIYLFKKKGD